MKKKFTAYFCDDNLVDVVLNEEDIKEDETKDWLIIGWPGVDGIEFRVKANENDAGVYAYYPIEQEHIKIADSDKDLVEKWKTGKISL